MAKLVGMGSGAVLRTKGSAVASAVPGESLRFLALALPHSCPWGTRGANLVTELPICGFVHYLVRSCGAGVSARVCVSLRTARARRLSTGMGAAELRYRRVLPELISSAEKE